MMRIRGLIVCLIFVMLPAEAPAQGQRARSILFLDQSDLRGPFYYEIFRAFRQRIAADAQSHVTIYSESLDLSRFGGAAHEQSLREYLREKYRDRPIGVIVAIGTATLELVLRWRDELWPGLPVVFGLIDDNDLARMKTQPNITGGTVSLRVADAIRAARAVVPHLNGIVFVGDDWSRQVVFGHWREEIRTAAAGLQVTEFIGLPMDELRQKVEKLPDRTAIIYSAVYSDEEGGFYPPAVSLKFISKVANRPIVVAAETFLESGGIGGFVLQPEAIGIDAAVRAIRIIGGEAVSHIPIAPTNAVKPIFNWLQMERWNVGASDLPDGSEIRFREPGLWQQYRWQSALAVTVLLMQAGLISVLLHERRRRSDAEQDARRRLSELAHVHRQSIAGELSSSIAHELNQPLGSILTNAETAEFILEQPNPDLRELKDILADIRHDDLRASQIIGHMRSLLKRTPFELKDVDLNDVMREAFELMSAQAATRNVALYLNTAPGVLPVNGDSIQLQQVILNLLFNAMDAMTEIPFGRTIIGKTEIDGGKAVISISDSGPGLPAENPNGIFDPFFTTKEQGMGIGLSIARTIVQAHKGRIWAENQPEGGATFSISLPLLPR
ncbi:MAG: GHKL domain-containing protein [Bradyrhizobium sp.]|nr:GHKL domain-containing protein [Bradyrhizobium sp.]